jgi:hypothetical protein
VSLRRKDSHKEQESNNEFKGHADPVSLHTAASTNGGPHIKAEQRFFSAPLVDVPLSEHLWKTLRAGLEEERLAFWSRTCGSSHRQMKLF